MNTNSTIPSDWKEKIPQWWQDITVHPERYFLVISDDDDAYFSCCLLHDLSGKRLKVEGYIYYEQGLYLTDSAKSDWKSGTRKPVFVDTGCVYGDYMTFNNHVVPNKVRNQNEINFNHNIGNYTDKFVGSTYLTLLWLYGVDLNIFSEDEILKALTTDSFQSGYYTEWSRNTHSRWMEVLGVKEIFLPQLEKYSRSEMNNIRNKTKFKVYVDSKGHLYSPNKSINLPKDREFKQVMQLKQYKKSEEEFRNLSKLQLKRVFTASQTYKNTVVYSMIA